MVKQARRPRHKRLPRALALAGVAVLALATVVVVSIALSQDNRVEAAGTVPNLPTPEPQVTEDPGPEPEPQPAPLPPAPLMQRMLAVGTDGLLLRAAVGECPAPAGTLEVSFDEGATWQPANTDSVGASRFLRLDTTDPAITRMVTLNSETCLPQAARSFVGGTSWQAADLVESPWYLDPADQTVVHTPVGARSLPCAAVSLSAEFSRAIVVCADASYSVSEDAGANWSAPIAAPYAVAAGTTASGFLLVTAGSPECTGIRTHLSTPVEFGAPGSCITSADAASPVAVAGSPVGAFLWSGDAIYRSFDEGVSWQ